MGVKTAATHALLLGGLGAYLTFSFTSHAGERWSLKDYLFVAAVILAVFYNRLTTMKYETLMQAEHGKRRREVHTLQRIEWLHGPPLQIEPNKVTVLLFFGTWCKDSRAALQELERLRKTFTHGAVQMIGLTQEKREELAAYEVKGRNASHFKEIKEFSFSVAIEDGLMSKEYLVRFDLFHIPQLFVIGKDQSVAWYGSPTNKTIEDIIRSELSADNVALEETKETLLTEDETTAVVSKKND